MPAPWLQPSRPLRRDLDARGGDGIALREKKGPAKGPALDRCSEVNSRLPDEAESHARGARREDCGRLQVRQTRRAADRLGCVAVRDVEDIEEQPRTQPAAHVDRL